MSRARDKANSTVSNFASTGIDDNADATAITIDSSENVGISNNIPSSFNAGANNLVVGSGSGSEGITIYGGAESNIFFADGTATADNLRGRIEYSHSSDVMSLYTNNAFAARIDSSGNVGISTSVPVANLEIEDGGTSNTILTKITADDQNPYALMIGNDTYSATDTNAFGFVQRNDGTAYIYNAGGLRAAFHNVSGGVLSLEGGVVLGAGAANSTTANTLDDYEIGTWSPSFTNGHTGAYTITNARYTKIGQQVYAGTYLSSLNIPNDSNPFYVAGLPFTVAGSQMYHAASSITFVHSFNIATKHVLPPTPSTGGNYVYFHRGDGTNAVMTNADFHGITNLIFGISYISDA